MVLNNESTPIQDMPRVRRSISFEKDLLDWIDKQVEDDYHFKDRSHFIEVVVKEYKDRIEVQNT